MHSMARHRVGLIGLGMLTFGALTLLGLLDIVPIALLSSWSHLAHQVFGWGVYPICAFLAIGGVLLMVRGVNRRFRPRAGQVIGLELMLLAALALTFLNSGGDLFTAFEGESGGLVGWALAAPAMEFLGPILTAVLYGGLFIFGLLLTLGVRWQAVREGLAAHSARLQSWSRSLEPQAHTRQPDEQPVADPTAAQRQPLPIVQPSPPRPARTVRRAAELPPLDLLEKGRPVQLSEAELIKKKQTIEQTLLDFNLAGQVTEIRQGPTVTQFGVRPGYLERVGPDGESKRVKVRVGQIAALRQDLALALAVTRLRIEAPVPGRGIVGIEAPNSDISLVRLRSVVETPAFTNMKSPLAVALGQGVAGTPVAIDLAKMPHLLIAGATGTGKSVCLNAFISCLVFNNSPDRVNLVMIDPKKVELIRFNGLPHLLGKVEVEHERVIGVLRWLMSEMDRRYEQFAALGAKNLEAYNNAVARREPGAVLSHIVVVIDELADLIALYPDEVERSLCRLAQMARATGIHLVVATQRPSTDVLTGLIKANFPARIAFAVASGTDSRVILDSVGAEQLLGRGDMLFLSPEASDPLRVQSCFVSDDEIERLVHYWRQALPDFEPGEAPWERILARKSHIDETDDMLEEAIALAQASDTLSTSYLQRRLRVGFPRAARLMEALHEMGLVEDPAVGGRTRRSLVSPDDEDPLDDFLSQQA